MGGRPPGLKGAADHDKYPVSPVFIPTVGLLRTRFHGNYIPQITIPRQPLRGLEVNWH